MPRYLFFLLLPPTVPYRKLETSPIMKSASPRPLVWPLKVKPGNSDAFEYEFVHHMVICPPKVTWWLPCKILTSSFTPKIATLLGPDAGPAAPVRRLLVLVFRPPVIVNAERCGSHGNILTAISAGPIPACVRSASVLAAAVRFALRWNEFTILEPIKYRAPIVNARAMP